MDQPLLKNLTFSTFLSLCLYSLEKLFFFFFFSSLENPLLLSLFLESKKSCSLSRTSLNTYRSILRKTQDKICHIFDRKHGLSPLEKCKFWDSLLSLFLDSTISLVFYQECHQTLLLKIKHERLSLLKPWTNPFGIM